MDRQRVLLLEDDAPLEGVLRDLFGDEGFDVTTCELLPGSRLASSSTRALPVSPTPGRRATT